MSHATPRHCPDCGTALQVKAKRCPEGRRIEVDLCKTCQGVFLEQGEFDAIIAPQVSQSAMEDFLRATARPATQCHHCGATLTGATCDTCFRDTKRPCPHDGTDLHAVHTPAVACSLCPACGGLWISGEDRRVLARSITASTPATPSARAQHPAKPSIALDYAQATPAPSHVDWVLCATCRRDVPRSQSLSQDGLSYCEQCLASGQVPGIFSQPSVEDRQRFVAIAMAHERGELERRKMMIGDARELVRHRGGFFRRGPQEEAIAGLVGLIRALFR